MDLVRGKTYIVITKFCYFEEKTSVFRLFSLFHGFGTWKSYIFLEILLKFGKNVPVLGNFYESMDLVVKTPCQVLNVHQKDYNWLKLCG